MTEEWNVINFKAHVADVMKPLASVVEMGESAMKVVFERNANSAGYIQSLRTGQKINLYREGREYKFDVWVPAQAESPAPETVTKKGIEVKNQFSALADDKADTQNGGDSDGEYAMDL